MSRGSRGRSRRGGDRRKREAQTQDQSRGQKKGGSRRGAKKRPFDPTKHFMPQPIPEREYEPCPLSGEPISNILTAIVHPETGRPANFDSVLGMLQRQEDLGENERMIYIGRGEFAVLAEDPKAKPRFSVRKRIQYEDETQRCEWRKELSPGISRDYTPSPQRLHELYEEAEAMVGATGWGRSQAPSIYLPKND